MHLKLCRVRFLPYQLLSRQCQTFNKYYEDGVAHVISQNPITKERATLRLSQSSEGIKKINHPITNSLPQQALQGLHEAILLCETVTPKQLQNIADQKLEMIRQRKLPAPPAEVQEARDNSLFRNYKWKPMKFKSREECAAYALATLPMHYAEAKFVLDELDRFGFRPESVLDFGSGIGGVFWAARQKWNNYLRDYSMVDPNEFANHFAMDVMRNKKTDTLIAPYVSFRKSIISSSNKTYDLVVAQRVFSEFDSHESRTDLIKLLWERTNKYLVLIEAHLPEHFKSLMHARAFIILMGIKFDTKTLVDYLAKNGLLTMEIKQMMDHPDAGLLEKYNFLKDRNIIPPTELERGHVIAPCPHDSGCPLQEEKDYGSVCAHMVKYKEIRVDGRTKSYEKSGLLRSFFTYTILCKGERPAGYSLARLLKKSEESNCVHCKLCTSFEGLQNFSVGKRAKSLYKLTEEANEGCLFPLEEKVVESDSELHFVRELLEKARQNG